MLLHTILTCNNNSDINGAIVYMVMMMGLKLRNAEESFYNYNLSNVFSFSTWKDNTSLIYIKKTHSLQNSMVFES